MKKIIRLYRFHDAFNRVILRLLKRLHCLDLMAK